MEGQPERQRVTWVTRINIKPAAREMIRELAGEERMSLATTIGIAIERYVTARSTS
jgi:hypothetical protein